MFVRHRIKPTARWADSDTWSRRVHVLANRYAIVPGMSARRFKRGDLVQLREEYEVHGNPSLFRIRRIYNGVATLGQLNPDSDSFCGVDTDVELDDPELIEPHAEILQMYSRHVR